MSESQSILGRKAKPLEQLRYKRVGVNLTEEEYDLVKVTARKQNCSMSQLFIKIADKIKDIDTTEVNRKTRAELNIIASHLNDLKFDLRARKIPVINDIEYAVKVIIEKIKEL